MAEGAASSATKRFHLLCALFICISTTTTVLCEMVISNGLVWENQLSCNTDDNNKAGLFVFGDSLYDPGNNNYINTTTDFQANFRPYGESFFPRPTGRFSDGRLIPDFICKIIYMFIYAFRHPLTNLRTQLSLYKLQLLGRWVRKIAHYSTLSPTWETSSCLWSKFCIWGSRCSEWNLSRIGKFLNLKTNMDYQKLLNFVVHSNDIYNQWFISILPS